MVATDTAVGIIGAVLLVAVMGGVFAYEYNNPVEEGSDDEGDRAHFEEDYSGLSAGDDLDGDGLPNYQDDDLDGDGELNAVDGMLSIVVPVSGSIGQSTPLTPSAPFTVDFTVGNGTEHVAGTITYTRTGAAALGVPTFASRIVDSSGETIATATSTTSGNTVTMTYDVAEPLLPGEYTVEVTQPGPGTGGSFSGNLEVHYAWPEERHGHGHDAEKL
jgi:hypothetical protein